MIQRYPEPQGTEFNQYDREIFDVTRGVAARHNVASCTMAKSARQSWMI
jgi:hypothetical protein